MGMQIEMEDKVTIRKFAFARMAAGRQAMLLVSWSRKVLAADSLEGAIGKK